MAEDTLKELNESYEQLVNELKSENDKFSFEDGKIDYGSSSSAFDNFKKYELDGLKLKGNKHAKKGFFSWLLGKDDSDDLNLNLDITKDEKSLFPDLKSEIVNHSSVSLKQDDHTTENAVLKLEKDFIDESKEDIDEPVASDFKTDEPEAVFEETIIKPVEEDSVVEEKPISCDDEFEGLISEIQNNISSSVPQQEISKPVIEDHKSESVMGKHEFDLYSKKLELLQEASYQNQSNINNVSNELSDIKQSINLLQQSINARVNDKPELDINSFKDSIKDMIKTQTASLVEQSSYDKLSEQFETVKSTLLTLTNKESANASVQTNQMGEMDSRVGALKSELDDIKSSLSIYVNQDELKKVRDMIEQVDVYVDSFDDRERELEKKYQENKNLLSKMELFEVSLNKQKSDNDAAIQDLVKKVDFVYKYLQQVQNNIYVLSKSVDLAKNEPSDGF